MSHPGCGRGHRGQPRGVGEQPGNLAGHQLGGQGGVGDHHAAAGIDYRQRIQPLFTVADRQRHVDGRQTDGGYFGDRHRPGPADHQIGGGVGQLHPVQIGHRHVRWVTLSPTAQLQHVLGSMGMQHANTGGGQVGGGAGHRPVERDRALRTPEHQQHPRVVGEAEVCPRLGSQHRAVQRGDRRTDRDPNHLGAPQPGIRHRGEHPVRGMGADPVGQSRPGVGFVDHHRDPAPAPGRQRQAASAR